MTSTAIRRVPWTCRWGRFGVAVENTAVGVTSGRRVLGVPSARARAPADETRRVRRVPALGAGTGHSTRRLGSVAARQRALGELPRF